MNFRTTIKPLEPNGLINHKNVMMMLGSCFSDNIGRKLQNALFNVKINPFGTLYNPASIASALYNLINNRQFNKDDLFEYMGRFHSFSHHSSFSGIDADSVIDNINTQVTIASQYLKNASTLIITFGTAFVFENLSTGEVVSNCHKLPAHNFKRYRLSVDKIVELWTSTISLLHQFNPDLKIIFTVSPIRHLADGAHGNQLSKSSLLLAIEQLSNVEKEIVYFPAYEIMMDDLRDYRFYAPDMTHPSEVAIEYIYDIFSKSFFSQETMELASECQRITRRLMHRHMTDNPDCIANFNASTQQLIDNLLSAHPYLQQAINNTLL